MYYLSSQEGQQRIRVYSENIVAFGKVTDQLCDSLTTEQTAQAIGTLAGDMAFGKGAPAIATLLKEIDALGKISHEAKIVGQGIRSVLKEHPAYANAEGIALKMSSEIKDVKNAAKPLINSEKLSENGNKLVKIENTLSSVNETSVAILKNGYYEVNGFKFTEFYYNRLWNNGREAPSFAAKAILEHATEIIPDPEKIPGFFKYFADGWEMVYNPTTKIVSHIQQIKGR